MTKVLLFDIETSPNVGLTWGRYEQDVLHFKKEWELLSIAWKWLGEKSTHVRTRLNYKDRSDKAITAALWALLDEADIVIAHNGRKFDARKSSAKFLEHGMPPPSPYKVIDTVLVARSKFHLNSNKLDDLGKLLGVGRKKHHGEGIDLWLRCMAGDRKAYATMAAYNKQDVVLLEKVYLKLRPWMGAQGDVHMVDGCPKCGSKHLQSRGFKATVASKYRQYQCQNCGAWSRGRLVDGAQSKSNKVGI